MVSFVAVVLFVVAALVVDLGLARDTKRQSQNTADAAALAAGNKLYTQRQRGLRDGRVGGQELLPHELRRAAR